IASCRRDSRSAVLPRARRRSTRSRRWRTATTFGGDRGGPRGSLRRLISPTSQYCRENIFDDRRLRSHRGGDRARAHGDSRFPYRGRPGQPSAVRKRATRPTAGPSVAKEGSMTGTLLTLVFLAVIIGAVVVIASSVARRRKRTDEAAILQSQLSDTIARE